LIASVTPILTERGIASSPDACPALSVRLERRGKQIVVSTASKDDERPTESIVSGVRTAATVIESWVRTDVEEPLLVSRPRVDAESPPDAAAVPPSATRGLYAFAAVERTFASDRTGWFGGQVGACVMLGRVCASTLLRAAAVTDGPAQFQNLDRYGFEILLGADLPIRLDRLTLSPGLGFGLGWTHTSDDGSSEGQETGGLRAESRVVASYSATTSVAVEVALTVEVTQATHVESSLTAPLPSEPRFLSRVGVGARFGGL
jgi:hypothetical protein